MEEKIIVRSENYNIKAIALTIFAVIVGGLSCIILGLQGIEGAPMILVAALYGAIPSAIIYWWLGSYQLVVTDKRIYGKVAFGKRVDLPVDSVSAVATSAMKGIAIATSSGRLYFKLIKNRDVLHTAISNLLIERQSKPTATTTIKQEIPQSNADELKKYKELLDSGVISQEEFDAMKKRLLGL